MVEISAIVCTYNREKFLPKALESLANQTLSYDNFEVVIINNNSTDSTEEICNNFHKNFPNINYSYVIESQQGLSFARNRGIIESKGRLITFIDDDAWLEEMFLEVIVNFMKKHQDVDSVGGKILLDYEDKEPDWMNKYMASLFGYFVYSENIKKFKPNNFPRGSNMTFRKNVFELVGNFNTELGRIGQGMGGGEEKDIYKRIYDHKLAVYNLPSAVVHHAVPVTRTTNEFIKKQAIGIGYSERLRLKGSKIETLKRIWQELYKWAATIILFFIYLLKFQWKKSVMIVRFRWWISKGFFIDYKKYE